MIAIASCAPRPVSIGLVFDNEWRLNAATLTTEEQTALKTTALRALQQAFHGFDVTVREGRSADRLVIVDTGYVAGLRQRGQPAPVGETLPFARASYVHFDEMFQTLLAVVGCADLAGCRTSREEMIEALGRGIGATAAHELGHQVGFNFAVDAICDACYDGRTSRTDEHFFGSLHWSDAALSTMRRVLPPDVGAH